MANLPITITDAGLAEITNATNSGTAPVEITAVAFGSGQYVTSTTQTTLQAETKRLTTIAGLVVSDDTIHVTIKDESADAYSVAEIGLFTASGTLFAVYSDQLAPFIEKTAGSNLMLSVDIKLTNVDATQITFGDTNFANPPASETVPGVMELATPAEVLAETDHSKAVTPLTLAERINYAKAGRKNLIINGGFDIWERGSADFVSPPNAVYTADRWKTWLSVQSTISKGTNELKITATSTATGYIGIRQLIETPDVLMAGKTITFSMKVKTNRADVVLRLAGSATTSTPHSGSGLYETLSVTFSGDVVVPTDAFGVTTNLSASIVAADYIHCKEAQIEIGTKATEFEYRHIGEELALCQRYYQLLRIRPYVGIGSIYVHGSGVAGGAYIPTPNSLRAIPTVVIKSGSLEVMSTSGLQTVTSVAPANIGHGGIGITVNYAVALGSYNVLLRATHLELELDAEI